MSEKRIDPQFPKQRPPEKMQATYFEPGDIITVHFHGAPQPAVSVPADGELSGLYWRVDPRSHEVVGLEIHGFLESFVGRYPEAMVFAKLANISKHLVRVRLHGPGDDIKDRQEFFAITDDIREFSGAMNA